MKKSTLIKSILILIAIMIPLLIKIIPEDKVPPVIEEKIEAEDHLTITEKIPPEKTPVEKPREVIEPVKDRGPRSLLAIKSDDVNFIEYISNKGKIRFGKNGTKWVIENGPENRIDEEKIKKIIINLFSLKSLETVSFSSEKKEKWGLFEESDKIRIKTEEGIISLHIGSFDSSKNGYYVLIEGADEIYLVSNSFSQSLKVSLDELRIRQLPPFDISQLSTLTLKKESAIKIVPFERSDMFTTGSFKYMITEPYLYSVPLSNQKISGFLDTMKVSLKIVDFIDEGNPEDFGLSPEGSKLTIKEKSGKTFDMLIGRDASQGKLYGKMVNEDQIFTLSKKDLPFLEIKAFDLIDLHPHLIELNTIDALSITTREMAIIGTVDRKENGNLYSINGMETEESVFKRFYNDILELQLEGELYEKALFDQPELTISYKLYDGGSYWTHLYFYPYQNGLYGVARNNEEALFTISRSQVKETLEKVTKTVDEVLGF